MQQTKTLRLNFGSGVRPEHGYINIDKQGNPDEIVDLESFPWPWDTSSVNKVRCVRVLEHMYQSRDAFLQFVKELYRVCTHDARIHVVAMNPKHEEFWLDPTRVRAILPETFHYFNKELNARWQQQGLGHSCLAEELEVDFYIDRHVLMLDPVWERKVKRGEIANVELQKLIRLHPNIVTAHLFDLKVRKS